MEVVRIKNSEEIHNQMMEERKQCVFQPYGLMKCGSGFRYLLNKRHVPVETFLVKNDIRNYLLVYCRIKGERCYLFGTNEAFDIVDFVYGDITEDELRKSISCFFNYLKQKNVNYFDAKYIPANSKTWAVLESWGGGKIENVKNVSINLDSQTYESYFSSLGKHARQNIRTANNRIDTDQKSVSFELVDDYASKKNLHRECMKTFIKRLRKRYAESNSKINMILHLFDYVSKGVMLDNGIICALRIDGQIAAFFEGFKDEQSILIPRLAIDTDYDRYSPGLLLCTEAIRSCYKVGGIARFNLLRGTEKYKYDLGGNTYFTNNIEIDLRSV